MPAGRDTQFGRVAVLSVAGMHSLHRITATRAAYGGEQTALPREVVWSLHTEHMVRPLKVDDLLQCSICVSPRAESKTSAAGVGRAQCVCVPARLVDGGASNEPLGICSHGPDHCICCNEMCGTETLAACHSKHNTGTAAKHLLGEGNERAWAFTLLLRAVQECNDA